MKTAEDILREYVDFKDTNGSETVEMLPLTIIDAMEEYASQFSMGIDMDDCLTGNTYTVLVKKKITE